MRFTLYLEKITKKLENITFFLYLLLKTRKILYNICVAKTFFQYNGVFLC